MKIVHISPSSTYNEYWGYQENLLPKYQSKLGHEVFLITTNYVQSNNGPVKLKKYDETKEIEGVTVIRKKVKSIFFNAFIPLISFIKVLPELEKIKPDVVFYHGLVGSTILDIVKYKKNHPNCLIVQDNHLDYEIGYNPKTLKGKIARCLCRSINKKVQPYVAKVYGVTPWRCQYAIDFFNIPQSKVDLLIMGADDEKMDLSSRNDKRKEIRNQYNIQQNDFLIVTGGKIDRNKNISNLINIVREFENVKLIVFGDTKALEASIFDNVKIINAGWIDAAKVYCYFYAADLVVFPGRHSVLWEQACASKVPCLFSKWAGMEHVNNGGNSCFFDLSDPESLRTTISSLVFTTKYFKMLEKANGPCTDIFLYSRIAQKTVFDFAKEADHK